MQVSCNILLPLAGSSDAALFGGQRQTVLDRNPAKIGGGVSGSISDRASQKYEIKFMDSCGYPLRSRAAQNTFSDQRFIPSDWSTSGTKSSNRRIPGAKMQAKASPNATAPTKANINAVPRPGPTPNIKPAGPSTSRRPPAPGRTRSRASSGSRPTAVSGAASMIPSRISRRRSTTSSSFTTGRRRSRSNGRPARTGSSPPAKEGFK